MSARVGRHLLVDYQDGPGALADGSVATGGNPRGSRLRTAHLVGIAGRGMSGLAQMLVQRGMLVTGSEPASRPAVERLRRLGARIHAGHSPRGLSSSSITLRSGAIIPSRLAATRRGIDQASVGQWLGLMMRQSISLAVVGRRTASIASAMIGWTLTRAGLDPTIVLGAEVPQLGGWGACWLRTPFCGRGYRRTGGDRSACAATGPPPGSGGRASESDASANGGVPSVRLLGSVRWLCPRP